MRAYDSFIPKALRAQLWQEGTPVRGVPDLRVPESLLQAFPGWLSTKALATVVSIYRSVAPELDRLLSQRLRDRQFVDERTLSLTTLNRDVDFLSSAYRTCITFATGMIGLLWVRSPISRTSVKGVETPGFLEGEQITLFGPPDSAKMAINAMNTLHRRLPNEASIVEELVQSSGQVPRWGR